MSTCGRMFGLMLLTAVLFINQALAQSSQRRVAMILVELPGSVSVLNGSQGNNLFRISTANNSSAPSINDLFIQATEGQVSFQATPKLFGPYLIFPKSEENCDKSYEAWSEEALRQSKKDKFRESNYDHVIFVFPKSTRIACSSFGRAEMFGKRSWIFDAQPAIIAHELGHNFGLQHSQGYLDQSKLESSEYGDRTCLMGAPTNDLEHFSAPQALNLTAKLSRRTDFLQLNESGNYNLKIAPLEGAYSALKIVRIGNNAANYLLLSYRVGTASLTKAAEWSGYNSKYTAPLVRGIAIHSIQYGRATLLGTLRDGGAFLDSAIGVSIKQLSHNPDQVVVNVEVKDYSALPAGCVVADPCSSYRLRACKRQLGIDFELQAMISGLVDSECHIYQQGQVHDSDGDGVPNENDCAPFDALRWQLASWQDSDSDGIGDQKLSSPLCIDELTDNVAERGGDNCPLVKNIRQADLNSDAIGDNCDPKYKQQLILDKSAVSVQQAMQVSLNTRLYTRAYIQKSLNLMRRVLNYYKVQNKELIAAINATAAQLSSGKINAYQAHVASYAALKSKLSRLNGSKFRHFPSQVESFVADASAQEGICGNAVVK